MNVLTSIFSPTNVCISLRMYDLCLRCGPDSHDLFTVFEKKKKK